MTRYDELDNKMASATVRNGAPIDWWLSCVPLRLFEFFLLQEKKTTLQLTDVHPHTPVPVGMKIPSLTSS